MHSKTGFGSADDMPGKRRRLIALGSLLIITLILTLGVFFFVKGGKERIVDSKGDLRPIVIKTGSAAVTEKKIKVSLNRTISLDGLTVNEIADARNRILFRFPYLIENYSPLDGIYKKIKNDSGWRTIGNMKFYGTKPESFFSADDFSEASHTIMNPLMLLTAFSASRNISNPAFRWKTKVTYDKKKTYGDDNIFVVRPNDLIWDPANSHVELHFMLGYFIEKQNLHLKRKIDLSRHSYGINAVNALDLGYHFIDIDNENSENIAQGDIKERPVKIFEQYRWAANTPKGMGWNQRRTYSKKGYRKIHIMELPALVKCNLWRKKPSEGQQPDLVYDLIFH